MTRHTPPFSVRLATSPAEVEAAQALRYRVFVEELGARTPAACEAARREWDRYDGGCEHLILVDAMRGDAVVGVHRLMGEAGAARAGGFASEEEFDIGPLRRSGLRLLELGRSCLHPDYRCGTAMHLLWQALGGLVAERGVGLVFGLASLRGTDLGALAGPVGHLMRNHLAPETIRPRSRAPAEVPVQPYERRDAVLALPPLVKAYLRMGGAVGEGVFVDRRFGCTDVCMVLDVSRPRQPSGGLDHVAR